MRVASLAWKDAARQGAAVYKPPSVWFGGLEAAAPWFAASRLYFGTTTTKFRTLFSSRIESGPSTPLNQNALDDPPSRFSARCTLRSGTIPAVARISPASASVTLEQNPSAARSPPPVRTKLR